MIPILTTSADAEPEVRLPEGVFQDCFQRFRYLVAVNGGGRPFVSFNEGVAAAEEGYKLKLRDHALGILAAETWSELAIGQGGILARTIEAIEIQAGRVNLQNNLVFWQNRYGPANRDHRLFLEAASDHRLCRRLERILYGLYRGDDDEGVLFDELSTLTGGKYPLLAYLFFLRDADRFMPIQPTTYDRAFRSLGVDLVTLHHCDWANYRAFNAALQAVRTALKRIEGLETCRLIDAHSFCWMLETFDDLDESAQPLKVQRGRIVGGVEKSIVAMRYSILSTVASSNGQIRERVVKDKTTSLSVEELEAHLAYLLERQGNRCELTGIPFDFHTADGDRNFRPSPDRIDSNGHYEPGNIQIVCQFINFWKGDGDDAEFRRLLAIVRGGQAQ